MTARRLISTVVISYVATIATADAAIVTTNLIVNLDAPQYTGPPADGASLDNVHWNDVSGAPVNNFAEGTAFADANPTYQSAGPETINGNAVVQFDNRDHYFENLGLSGDQSVHMFYVGRLGTSWGSIIRVSSDDLNVQNEGWSITRGGSDTDVTMESGFGDNLSFSLGGGIVGSPFILEVSYAGGGWNGTNVSAYVNGTEVTVSGGSGNPLSYANENTSFGSIFNRAMNQDIGQMLFYSAELSEAQRNETGAALAATWGISTSYSFSTGTPEPASAMLMGMGLAGVVFLRRRRTTNCVQ